jgi:hypothetical protein
MAMVVMAWRGLLVMVEWRRGEFVTRQICGLNRKGDYVTLAISTTSARKRDF